MRPFVLFILILVGPALSVAAQAAGPTPERPLTRREVRRWLTITQHDPELSAQANRDMIAEIERRGVEFALSEQEEWSFKLLEASDELLEAIRDAIPPEQRRSMLAGQEFVERFGADPAARDQVNIVKRQLPQLERIIRALERTTRIRTN